MNVFLAEPNTRYDLSSLSGFGPVVSLSDTALNPFSVNETLIKLSKGLIKMDPSEDYLCLTGNLLSVSLMMMIAYSKFSSFKILVFDARTSNYRERLVTHV